MELECIELKMLEKVVPRLRDLAHMLHELAQYTRDHAA